MTTLERMRTIFIALLAVFLALDLGLIGYMVWPGGPTKESRRAEEKQLQQNLALEKLQVTPLRGIDKKLLDTRTDIKKFYDQRVPAYESEISTELHKLEQQNSISVQNIHYAPDETGLPNLERVKIETTVVGDYVKIAHFINSLERDKLLFLINQISVSGQATGTVQLQIKFETFLKGAA